MASSRSIVLGVTASIAIYKACDIIRRLKEKGYSLTVVMTAEAEELIRPIVFQSLSGNKVFRGLFDLPESWDAAHISLADGADLVLIAPATANIIAKIASGICDDLLTCVVAATQAPVLICPAMNDNMYLNKITQANIAQLKGLGYHFVEPEKGRLACGRVGLGCLADVDKIAEEAIRLIKKKTLAA